MEVVDAYKKYGVLYVSQFEFGAIIWRPLSWNEVGLYEKLFLVAPGAKADLEEQIFNDCVTEHPLPQEDFEHWRAGIVTTVANQIVKVSAATRPEEFLSRLEATRQEVSNNALYQIFATIMRVFPYKMEDLLAMPLETLLERLAMVEIITGEQIQIQIEQPSPAQLRGGVDTKVENRRFSDVDHAPPEGDWNLDRMRGIA